MDLKITQAKSSHFQNSVSFEKASKLLKITGNSSKWQAGLCMLNTGSVSVYYYEMEIKKIKENKASFMELLLLGDEQENMVHRYLDRGELYALYDGGLITVSVVTKEAEKTYEIKNIATYEKFQGKRYGSRMIKFIIENYRNKCDLLLVGTGDNEKTLSFYYRNGFVYSHTVENFFTDNYDHPMFEDGKQLVDMIYLKMDFTQNGEI
ncbi:MAG: GNAT family N-acetyltransferase [Treponema sp.]|nr:GNAT family N-acetyltransferase [Treponema sp.]